MNMTSKNIYALPNTPTKRHQETIFLSAFFFDLIVLIFSISRGSKSNTGKN